MSFYANSILTRLEQFAADNHWTCTRTVYETIVEVAYENEQSQVSLQLNITNDGRLEVISCPIERTGQVLDKIYSSIAIRSHVRTVFFWDCNCRFSSFCLCCHRIMPFISSCKTCDEGHERIQKKDQDAAQRFWLWKQAGTGLFPELNAIVADFICKTIY